MDMMNQCMNYYEDNSKSVSSRIIIPKNIDDVAPSSSEKLIRKEIGKLTQNSNEIRIIREKMEKSWGSK